MPAAELSREWLAGKRAVGDELLRSPARLPSPPEYATGGSGMVSAPSAQGPAWAQVTSRPGDGDGAEEHALQRALAADSAGAGPALLRLQRQYGNRFVGRVLSTRRNGHQVDAAGPGPILGRAAGQDVVRRFGSEEHTRLGDTAVSGRNIDIGTEVGTATYGELVAMLGDWFESVAQIRQLASDIYGADQVRYVLQGGLQPGPRSPRRPGRRLRGLHHNDEPAGP